MNFLARAICASNRRAISWTPGSSSYSARVRAMPTSTLVNCAWSSSGQALSPAQSTGSSAGAPARRQRSRPRSPSARHVALQQHRGVVPGTVLPPVRSPAARLVLVVRAGVPPLGGHVDPAADRDPVVDDGDLLVMAAADGVMSVELEVDPLVRPPAGDIEQHRTAAEELDEAEAPLEYPDIELGPVPAEPKDKAAEPLRALPLPRPLPPAPPYRKVDASVEVPRDQHDPPLGLEHGLLHEREIVRRIDDHAGTTGHGVPPHAGLDRAVVERLRRRVFLGQSPLTGAYSLAFSSFSGVTSASAFSARLRRSNTARMCARSSSVR